MNQKTKKNKAIFLDRDGTIIEERGYICHLSESAIFPFSFEAIRLMQENGFKVIAATNQACIARGICTKDQVEKVHEDIRQQLLQQDAVLDAIYYSPWHPEGIVEEFKGNHPFRKPKPGMLRQASKDFDINLRESFMIGDSAIDIMAGKKAGCRTVLVLTGKGKEQMTEMYDKDIFPDMVCDNILGAINMILATI